jgi:hypothetical protein
MVHSAKSSNWFTQIYQSLLTETKREIRTVQRIEKYNPKELASEGWRNCTQNVAQSFLAAKAEKGEDELH